MEGHESEQRGSACWQAGGGKRALRRLAHAARHDQQANPAPPAACRWRPDQPGAGPNQLSCPLLQARRPTCCSGPEVSGLAMYRNEPRQAARPHRQVACELAVVLCGGSKQAQSGATCSQAVLLRGLQDACPEGPSCRQQLLPPSQPSPHPSPSCRAHPPVSQDQSRVSSSPGATARVVHMPAGPGTHGTSAVDVWCDLGARTPRAPGACSSSPWRGKWLFSAANAQRMATHQWRSARPPPWAPSCSWGRSCGTCGS